mmetsp:Transcript_16734/g.36296  ORF Transcript_16734/g.36296 Transcript_16734/m.36296 type:complete len:213 (+) Transcript_16734:329-967(+)|eukprot:CAMPEP_0172565436 /NCGR_PEP_ID=MMETSP1067-20121228/108086_1 /TAXON_ID=265564 ORGANISM="Thalassiosira punctigera, Strain Tpunct2005C2" /NCGR_SAMPLE_ID=MMETSP1067 /ASSEMBLY_ACC=CAM_ASM_000444 /LENGTH=212 /DNA_ID=CAMNT_0013356303 /DNA_START=235 /DNA_END=873 /DNA_ORIENTATION=+
MTVTSHLVSRDGVTTDPVPGVALDFSIAVFASSPPTIELVFSWEGIAREAILDAILSITTMYISKSRCHSSGREGSAAVTPRALVFRIRSWSSSVELGTLANVTFTNDDCSFILVELSVSDGRQCLSQLLAASTRWRSSEHGTPWPFIAYILRVSLPSISIASPSEFPRGVPSSNRMSSVNSLLASTNRCAASTPLLVPLRCGVDQDDFLQY